MKKIIFSVTSAFCFFALTQSCNRQENLPPDASAIDEKEPTSVIDQMEKERGVKFFKKDVVLKDANGSEITMRYASEKQEHLDIYLKMHDMTLNSSFKDITPPAPEPQNIVAPKANSNTVGPDLEGAIHVMSEQISAKMAEGIKSHSLNTSASKKMQNAKVALNAPFYLEDYSPVYRPDGYKITVWWDKCWLLVDFRPHVTSFFWFNATSWLELIGYTERRVELGVMPAFPNGCWVARAKLHYDWNNVGSSNYTSEWQH